jgi:hypothetical protein
LLKCAWCALSRPGGELGLGSVWTCPQRCRWLLCRGEGIKFLGNGHGRCPLARCRVSSDGVRILRPCLSAKRWFSASLLVVAAVAVSLSEIALVPVVAEIGRFLRLSCPLAIGNAGGAGCGAESRGERVVGSALVRAGLSDLACAAWYEGPGVPASVAGWPFFGSSPGLALVRWSGRPCLVAGWPFRI